MWQTWRFSAVVCTSRMATFLSATVPSAKPKTAPLTNTRNALENAFERCAILLESHEPSIKKALCNTSSEEGPRHPSNTTVAVDCWGGYIKHGITAPSNMRVRQVNSEPKALS